MKIVKCKNCGADILWLKTIKNKLISVNAQKKKLFVRALGHIHSKYELFEGWESHSCLAKKTK